MTDPEALDLGRRAVACKGWRWRYGMKIRWEERREPHDVARITEYDHSRPIGGGGWWPDFRDPATVGCMLELVREAWGRPEAAALRYPDNPDADGGWFVLAHTLARSNYDLWLTTSPSPNEPAALVAALEAAAECAS